jgi:hypothetical protein
VGDCVDETLFFWYLICGGALDVFPTLKTYINHAGGMAVFPVGRLAELNKSMAPDARNKRPLMDYLPNFWFDLTCSIRHCAAPLWKWWAPIRSSTAPTSGPTTMAT